MQLRDIARLASCRIFADIQPGELAKDLETIPHSLKFFEEKSMVLLAGCKYSSLYILVEGEAFAEMTSDDGKVVRVESFKAGEALATAMLFTSGQTLPVSVEARTDCRFAVIPKDSLLALCMRHKPILEALLLEMGSRLFSLTEKLKAAQFISLREKLADWLLRRRELSGSATIRLEATRERMAELFGVARPSLSRELGALQRLGILELSGKEIMILDVEGLRKLRNSRSSSPR
ncbi:MAG TPA: Crp/Fnr family transcriptional regulator [Rectinemataceae bacterium]|nr:Crp/Fnr family transcriptional regulator [Rectinemataceae bacterium]